MNLLLVKTSSFGDLLHTLPALRDLARLRPDVRVHWVVEEGFAQLPTWADNVVEVIPVAWRRWRKHPWHAWHSGEFSAFLQRIRYQEFDAILDAQGLIKSALIARLANGVRHGPDYASAREKGASFFYQTTHRVPTKLHAVTRLRRLFAHAFKYPEPADDPDFGLDPARFISPVVQKRYLCFLHGTTWPTKHWPETHWQNLAQRAGEAGWRVVLPWGNAVEKSRAQSIAASAPSVCLVLPRLTLEQLAGALAGAGAVIATDTGPAHLAAALGVPTVALYGPTPAERIGIVGRAAARLTGRCKLAPCRQRRCPLEQGRDGCMHSLSPEQVWQTVGEITCA
ncbi:MAG: lipopolysaccharide heptosyltransferase I [Magnetococcus sp. YQC-9]